MNNKFKEIGIISEDKLIEFIDQLVEEEEIKNSLYGFFTDACAFSDSGDPAYVVMTKCNSNYWVWVTEELSDSYVGSFRYDLCDVFFSYEEADVYFKSLENTGIKSGKEQIKECERMTIDPDNVKIVSHLSVFDTIDFEVYYRNCLVIEHMKSLDYNSINEAIAAFNDLCKNKKIMIYRIYKRNLSKNNQLYYTIEYRNQMNELQTVNLHIPSILQGQKRCVFDLLNKDVKWRM